MPLEDMAVNKVRRDSPNAPRQSWYKWFGWVWGELEKTGMHYMVSGAVALLVVLILLLAFV
jgi:hypothetical protein